MQIIKPGTKFDFIGIQKFTFMMTTTLIILTIISLIYHKGPKLGVDFSGGSIIQAKFPSPVPIDSIKSGLDTIGVNANSIQEYGKQSPGDCQYLINTDVPDVSGPAFSDRVIGALKTSTSLEPEILRIEMVGPKVGHELREKGLLAIFFSMLFISIYISVRFELKWMESVIVTGGMIGAVELFSFFHVGIPILILVALVVSLLLFWLLNMKYAMGAIVALIHDVTITVGAFSILEKEFTLQIIAALLTIIGYSLNDTIIVYDRIRENLKLYPKRTLRENINLSVNETLSRTILTSSTVMMVVVVLYFFGGSIIRDFAFAMIVGTIVGTYSSIYIASPILLLMQNQKQGTGKTVPKAENRNGKGTR